MPDDFHRLEGDRAAARGLDDQVGLAYALHQLGERRLPRADVVRAESLGNFGLSARLGRAGDRVDVEPPQPQDQRRQQADLPGAGDEGPLGLPHLQAALGFVRLLHGLGGAAHRLGQNVQMLEPDGHPHHELAIVDVVLGHKTVQQIDAPLVVNLLAGNVGAADLVEDRMAGPPHGARDVVARLYMSDLGADRLDAAKRLVPQHQKVIARRRVAVERLVDLAIGGVHADPQHLDQHAAPARHIIQPRHRHVGQMNAIFSAGTNGNGFHGGETLLQRSVCGRGGRGNHGELISSRSQDGVKSAVTARRRRLLLIKRKNY